MKTKNSYAINIRRRRPSGSLAGLEAERLTRQPGRLDNVKVPSSGPAPLDSDEILVLARLACARRGFVHTSQIHLAALGVDDVGEIAAD